MNSKVCWLFCVLFVVCATFTTAFATADDVVWTATYDGPARDSDNAVALALDADGNILVAGYVCVELIGDYCLDYDIALIKYAANGAEQWSATWGGSGGDDDFAHALAVDRAGNAYVAGSACVQAQADCIDHDWFVLKYSAEGELQWTDLLHGDTERGIDLAHDLAIYQSADDDPQIYVVGTLEHQSTGLDYTLVKYDQDGTREWVESFDGYAGGTDQALACAVGPGGDLYATGEAGYFNQYLNTDFLSVRYTSAGERRWINYYETPLGLNEYGQAVAVGADGSAVVSGEYCWDRSHANTGLATIKYSPDGLNVWTRLYTYTSYNYTKGLALDPTGNVHLVSPANRNYLTILYDSAGEPQWTALIEGFPEALVVDGDGHTFITGSTTVEYDELGRLQWNSSTSPTGSDLVLDDQGYLYVTGIVFGEGHTNGDIMTVKYAPACQGCLIDNECIEQGEINPENDCQVCDPERAVDRWSDQENGSACDDGLWCTVNDTCQQGACTSGNPRDCDDGLWCTGAEGCNEQFNRCDSSGSPCEDWEVCIEQGHACVGGGPPDDDDDDDDACGETGPRGAQRSSPR